jgi:hypothetical protein
MESEFKELLDREKHKKDVKKYFSAHIDVLVDMVNYGSWLIPRAYDSSQKKLEDAIIIGVLLKQVVTMIDSVEVLTSNATIYPAFLQSRAAFEASLFIDWIIKENSEKKTKYYYVFNLRNKRKWDLRLIEGTPQQQKFTNDIQELSDYINIQSKDAQEIAQKELLDINRVLNQDAYKDIDTEFQKINIKRGIDLNWYSPIIKNGSLGTIAKDTNRIPEYLFFMKKARKLCIQLHTLTILNSLTQKEELWKNGSWF